MPDALAGSHHWPLQCSPGSLHPVMGLSGPQHLVVPLAHSLPLRLVAGSLVRLELVLLSCLSRSFQAWAISALQKHPRNKDIQIEKKQFSFGAVIPSL